MAIKMIGQMHTGKGKVKAGLIKWLSENHMPVFWIDFYYKTPLITQSLREEEELRPELDYVVILYDGRDAPLIEGDPR